jgi:hypothetical protein
MGPLAVATVRAFVGADVGDLVGSPVGGFDGDLLGASVGAFVGDLVGALVGGFDGDLLGAFGERCRRSFCGRFRWSLRGIFARSPTIQQKLPPCVVQWRHK